MIGKQWVAQDDSVIKTKIKVSNRKFENMTEEPREEGLGNLNQAPHLVTHQ